MKIYKNTVSDILWEVLSKIMGFEELNSYRLVGGTSLGLLLGHRISIDIDLFTDAEYDSIDFNEIDKLFVNAFSYVEMNSVGNESMGKSYFIGQDQENSVKVDLFYTDPFIYPIVDYNGIRLSQLEEIIAMKLEVIGHGGRKKDFWDLHELLEHFTISEMLGFYEKRYPYGYSRDEIINGLTDFEEADLDFDPICLKSKYWELIKLDFQEIIEKDYR